MMPKTKKSGWMGVSAWLLLGLFVVAIPACGRQRRSPLEQAGHEIDDSAEDVSEAVDEATD